MSDAPVPIPTDGAPWDRLRALVARLRAPGGCPWDREQTHGSIRSALLEECHEVIDAIDREHAGDLREELGDILLHVVLHARIAEEAGHFDIDAVVETLIEKLIRRHPHVFGAHALPDSQAVLRQWEEIKQAEKEHADTADALASVPRTLPALLRAERIQRRASRLGLDWEQPGAVIDKVREELDEVRGALDAGDAAALAAEIGDLLFAVVNLARLLHTDPELALHASAERFIGRVRGVERRLRASGHTFADRSPAELDAFWEQTKSEENDRVP